MCKSFLFYIFKHQIAFLGYAFNLISSENDYNVMKAIKKYFNFTIDEITIEGISQLETDQE